MALPNLQGQTIAATYTGVLQVNNPPNTSLPGSGQVLVCDGNGAFSSLSIGQANAGASITGLLSATSFAVALGSVLSGGNSFGGGLSASDSSNIVLSGGKLTFSSDNITTTIGVVSGFGVTQAIAIRTGNIQRVVIGSTGTINVSGGAIIGSPTVAKAWCSFNGFTGSLSSGFGVSSVTRNIAGSYTLNFSPPINDPGYITVGNAGTPNGAAFANGDDNVICFGHTGVTGVRTSTQCNVFCEEPTNRTLEDAGFITVIVYGLS